MLSSYTNKQEYRFSLFVANAFDIPTCTSVLESLVSLYGIIPAGVKLDAYTCAGIHSRHPSEIDSLVLRPRDIEGGMQKVKVRLTILLASPLTGCCLSMNEAMS